MRRSNLVAVSSAVSACGKAAKWEAGVAGSGFFGVLRGFRGLRVQGSGFKCACRGLGGGGGVLGSSTNVISTKSVPYYQNKVT